MNTDDEGSIVESNTSNKRGFDVHRRNAPDTLFANQGAVSYQWYHNGVLISGATDYYYIATGSGNFNVVSVDIDGCQVEAAIFYVGAGITSSFTTA